MAKTRPNLLFIMPDQLRHDFLSCYGAGFIETPNIDSIGEEGVRYNNCYSGSPICVPARTTLLTGMNAIRTGVLDNLHGLRLDHEKAGIRTWPAILSNAGYCTAGIGKMHFYPWDALHGFDRRVICEDKLWATIRDDYYHYLKDHGLKKFTWKEYGGYAQEFGSAYTDMPWEHSWDRYTGKEACRFIDEYSEDQPFAIMVGFPGPHDPYDPSDDFPVKYDPDDMPAPIPAAKGDPAGLMARRKREYREVGMNLEEFTERHARINRARYAGLVKQIDHEVGDILESLRRRGMLDHTVVIFASDHGDLLGDHGMPGKNLFFEGSAHVPLLVRMPGGPRGAVCDDLVELRDVTATLLSLGGCEIPSNMDAQPIPALDLDDTPPRQRVFGFLRGGWMAFDGRWKLCRYYSSEAPLLYDLKTDPMEQNNVADDPANREVRNRLEMELTRELMDSIEHAMHDRLPAPRSLALDESFGMKGWNWDYPMPATEAAKVRRDAQ